jgi:hypothetical protein
MTLAQGVVAFAAVVTAVSLGGMGFMLWFLQRPDREDEIPSFRFPNR